MDATSIVSASRNGTMIDAADLVDPETRKRIYASMHRSVTVSDRGLLRQLLLLEMTYRADESGPSDYFENLHWCGLLLYQIGSLDDVILLWKAKKVNFDTFCEFDIQFLVGGGVDATIEYLTKNQDSETKDVIAYIQKCRESGDFIDMDHWLASRLAYHH